MKMSLPSLTEIGNMSEFNLTHSQIRQASTIKLRKILKEDIPVELDDMINYELYIREYS